VAWEEEVCGMNSRGGVTCSCLPGRGLDPSLCPSPWEMDSVERYSPRDSRPGAVSHRVLESRLVVPLHLHTQVRLRLHHECAFDQDYTDDDQDASAAEPLTDCGELTCKGLVRGARGVIGRQLRELGRFLSCGLLPSHHLRYKSTPHPNRLPRLPWPSAHLRISHAL